MARIASTVAMAVACLVLAACGSTTSRTVTERVTASAGPAPARASSSHGSRRPRGSRTPASAGRTARQTRWLACDDHVRALRPHTSCGFAQNAFYAYWQAEGASSIEVFSPAVGRSFATRCSAVGPQVTCRTGDGGRVRFPIAAVDAYSADQAADYASTHDLGATSASQTAGLGDADLADTEASPADDDLTGDEIPNYENGTGYRVQCADGMYSRSGGRPGACSGHGGVR